MVATIFLNGRVQTQNTFFFFRIIKKMQSIWKYEKDVLWAEGKHGSRVISQRREPWTSDFHGFKLPKDMAAGH